MKKYLIIAFIALGFSATAQQSPTNKTRSNNDFSQVDNYLIGLKRLGIPTSETDNLDAAGLPQNTMKLIYNTTLGKLRVYNPVAGTWADASPTDLSGYLTLSGGTMTGNLAISHSNGSSMVYSAENIESNTGAYIRNAGGIELHSTEGTKFDAWIGDYRPISVTPYGINFDGTLNLTGNSNLTGSLNAMSSLNRIGGYTFDDKDLRAAYKSDGSNWLGFRFQPDDEIINVGMFPFNSALQFYKTDIYDSNGTKFLKQGDAIPFTGNVDTNFPGVNIDDPFQIVVKGSDGTIRQAQKNALFTFSNGLIDRGAGRIEFGGLLEPYGIQLGNLADPKQPWLRMNEDATSIGHGDYDSGPAGLLQASSSESKADLNLFVAGFLGQRGIAMNTTETNRGIVVNDAIGGVGLEYNGDYCWANAGPQTMMPKKYIDNNFIKDITSADNPQNASFNLNGNGLLNGDLKTNSIHVNSIELGTIDGDLKIAPQGIDKIKITGNLNIGTSNNIAVAEIAESYSTFHGAVIADNNTSGSYNYFESQDNTAGIRGTYRSNGWGFGTGTGFLKFIVPEFDGGHNITFPIPEVNANVAYQSDLERYLPLAGGTINGDLATVNDRSFAMYKTEDQRGDRIVWTQEYLKWIKDGETWFNLNQGSFSYNGNTDFHGSQNVYGNLWVGTMPNITGQPYQFVVKDQTSGNMSVINDKFLSLSGGVMEGRISGASDAGTWSFGRNSESGKFNFDFNNDIIALNGGLNLSNSLKASNGISADGGEGAGGFNVPIGVSGSQPMLGFRSRGYGKSAGIGYSSGGLDFWIKGNNNADLIATGIRPLRIADNGRAEFLDDVELIDATKGIILHSPNGTRYRVTINDAGDFVKTAL
ncbi:hypothetical protein GCM10022289_07850 [Pedobacter jeongneungensis]|uniref:Uncharacterized protein n=1 Tax=Pedobacter jeongneungensis TaxID=947309 RepID=A0ABP8B719_9SPHI